MGCVDFNRLCVTGILFGGEIVVSSGITYVRRRNLDMTPVTAELAIHIRVGVNPEFAKGDCNKTNLSTH